MCDFEQVAYHFTFSDSLQRPNWIFLSISHGFSFFIYFIFFLKKSIDVPKIMVFAP